MLTEVEVVYVQYSYHTRAGSLMFCSLCALRALQQHPSIAGYKRHFGPVGYKLFLLVAAV
jgi:hypothetical protein